MGWRLVALLAGRAPARRPMSAPVRAARAGRVGSRMGVHWRVAATVMMVMIPRVAPMVPPMSPVMADSVRNWAAMWVRDAPRDRRRPISGVRSMTDTNVMLAIPTAPTARMRRPSARKSPLRSDWIAFLTKHGKWQTRELCSVAICLIFGLPGRVHFGVLIESPARSLFG